MYPLDVPQSVANREREGLIISKFVGRARPQTPPKNPFFGGGWSPRSKTHSAVLGFTGFERSGCSAKKKKKQKKKKKKISIRLFWQPQKYVF